MTTDDQGATERRYQGTRTTPMRYRPTLDTWLLAAILLVLVLILLGVGVVDGPTW